VGLNLSGVDDSADIRVGKKWGWKSESGFLFGVKFVSTKNRVELFEGAFSPDDESPNVSPRGELKKIQSRDVAEFNTRDISEGLN